LLQTLGKDVLNTKLSTLSSGLQTGTFAFLFKHKLLVDRACVVTPHEGHLASFRAFCSVLNFKSAFCLSIFCCAFFEGPDLLEEEEAPS
jgi:hypothetical protein